MNQPAHKTAPRNHTKHAWFTPSSFTGKERDEETGYGYLPQQVRQAYHGARYMDYELMTMWLSVDPMADKYPSISPYAYCAWNPVKLVDSDGMEALKNEDGWKVDNLNRTITRVSLDGGNTTQFVEGDGLWIRNESRADVLNEYKDYTVIDNVQSGTQLNPSEERSKSDAVSPETVAGAIIGGTGLGCNSMSKAIFDPDKGTYMGKDGSTKIIQRGKNGGLNGRHKPQINASTKYAKIGRVCNIVGVATSIASMDNTERQYMEGTITQTERWVSHAIDIIGCTPWGCMAPVSYELGKHYGVVGKFL